MFVCVEKITNIQMTILSYVDTILFRGKKKRKEKKEEEKKKKSREREKGEQRKGKKTCFNRSCVY